MLTILKMPVSVIVYQTKKQAAIWQSEDPVDHDRILYRMY